MAVSSGGLLYGKNFVEKSNHRGRSYAKNFFSNAHNTLGVEDRKMSSTDDLLRIKSDLLFWNKIRGFSIRVSNIQAQKKRCQICSLNFFWEFASRKQKLWEVRS